VYKARIPLAAYNTPVIDLGLSARVLSHIERSGLTNVGQIHERLAAGDEAMLAIDGIGPKGLAEIKQLIEDKGLGLTPLPEPTPVAAAPIEVPAAEAAAPIEVSAAEAAAVAEVASVVEQPAAAVMPIQPEAITPAAEVAPIGEPALAVPVDVEEIEDEDELERKGGKKKGKRKDRTLVFDETSGTVVAKKQHKAGRAKDVFELLDEEA